MAMPAAATTVFIMSVTPGEVSMVVNGSAVRNLRPGEASPEGVKLLEIRGDTAVVEIDGRRWEMRIGSRTASSVVLQSDARGHFMAGARINGASVPVLVDTGASVVSMNMQEARRLGVDFTGAQRIVMRTANGERAAWRVRLASVQIGDIVLANVEGSVADGGPEVLPVVLLGMSFLNQVDMQRSGANLTLTRRH